MKRHSRWILLGLLSSAVAQAQITLPPGTGDRLLQGMVGMMGQLARGMQDSGAGLAQSNPMLPQAGTGIDAGPGPSTNSNDPALDGAWRGGNGEYLLIEGQRFRLHANARSYVDGRLQLRNGLLGFYYPQRQAVLIYRYQIEGGQLQLQDQQGTILRFQQVQR